MLSFLRQPLACSSRLCRRAAERTLVGVARVYRHRLIAPQPAHHFRQDRSALLLAMQADPEGVVDVVTFFRQGTDHLHVLCEPVALLVIRVAAQGAVIVPAVLDEDADGLLLGCE